LEEVADDSESLRAKSDIASVDSDYIEPDLGKLKPEDGYLPDLGHKFIKMRTMVEPTSIFSLNKALVNKNLYPKPNYERLSLNEILAKLGLPQVN